MPPSSLFGILTGKTVINISRFFNLGFGGTWPGELALKISHSLLKDCVRQLKKGIIVVAGTNGKTTTSLMLNKILTYSGEKIIHNHSGANLINGVASSFIAGYNLKGGLTGFDYAVLEIDENSLPLLIEEITPKIIVCTNLFRDQLDRYGEVDTIAQKWQKVLKKLPSSSTVILNADDPQIAFLGNGLKAKVVYFGVNDPSLFLKIPEHATDSIFCLNCGKRLVFKGIYFSHIGLWSCKYCRLKRPDPVYSAFNSVLPGLYNRYNTLAATAAASELNIDDDRIKNSLKDFSPAFGRQEEFSFQGKKVKIFLAKNPAGFNITLKTVRELKGKNLLLVLNDRIPDGGDISWIWDVDFEQISGLKNIAVSGRRTDDLVLRLDYAGIKTQFSESDLKTALKKSLNGLKKQEILYILPTYSAMLEVRKILSGKRIL